MPDEAKIEPWMRKAANRIFNEAILSKERAFQSEISKMIAEAYRSRESANGVDGETTETGCAKNRPT
jgi:hypothetical protein